MSPTRYCRQAPPTLAPVRVGHDPKAGRYRVGQRLADMGPGRRASSVSAMSEDLVEARSVEQSPAETASSDDETPVERSTWQRWREHRRNRVTRWDRPPPPKDWRYFVGTLGKVLIVTGLLMFGFVAYQLWGTGIETARAQNQLQSTFEEQFDAAVDQPSDETSEPEPETEPGADATDEAEVESDPGSAAEPTEDDEPSEPAVAPGIGGASAIVPGGVDVSQDAVEQDVPIFPGEAFAKLDIDKIGISDLYVIPGVQLDDLKKGPGHYPDTPLPGQLGNASLAGHRTTYGAPFFDLDQLEPGDEIVVTMVTGDEYVYSVTGSQVVTAADYWVITTRDPNVAELTLTTCDPKYTARDRLVVHSVLVPERSSRVGVANFYDLDELEGTDGVGDKIAGDDPTMTVPDDVAVGGAVADDQPVSPDTVDEPASEASSDDPLDEPTSEAGSDDAAVATADGAGAQEQVVAEIDPESAEIDAFSEGWFDDRDAFPQIALWGLVLTLIALLVHQISKKTRHDSIGLLVGVVPFLIALYFFYQNVNRLLPPGL